MEHYLFITDGYPLEPICRSLRAAGIVSTVVENLAEWRHLLSIRTWHLVGIAGSGDFIKRALSLTTQHERCVALSDASEEVQEITHFTTPVQASQLIRWSQNAFFYVHETAEMACGNLLLSLNERIAWWRGTELQLTPRQFSIVRLLASSPGRVYTRSELWEHGWGLSDYPESNAIDAHIRRIRRRVPRGLAQCIRSVYGVGYRFVPDGAVTQEPENSLVLTNTAT